MATKEQLQALVASKMPDNETGQITPAGLRELQNSIIDELYLIEESVVAGVIGFPDKATMDADLDHDAGTIARVMTDSTPANNGDYLKTGASGAGSWNKESTLIDSAIVKEWVSSESFEISNITYTANDNIATADLDWPDGESGSISNVVEDSEGRITSIRYNRPNSKYVTLTITYSGDNVASTALTATGY